MWIGRLNTVKMSVLPKLNCTFNSIPIKISTGFLGCRWGIHFCGIWQVLSKISMGNSKSQELPRHSWRRQGGRICLIRSQDVKQSYIKQSSVTLHKDRQIEQQLRTESRETGPCTGGHLTFDTGGSAQQWGGRGLFGKCCWNNWLSKWKIT